MSQARLDAFVDEILKLARCQSEAIKTTGGGKTRTGRMPINVDTMVNKEKQAAMIGSGPNTMTGNLGMVGSGLANVGQGAVNILGKGLSAVVRRPAVPLLLGVGALAGAGYQKLKQERRALLLGRQYSGMN